MEEKSERVDIQKISKKSAEKIYGTGGKVIVKYVYEADSGDVPREASFRYVDCGLDFECIKRIYKMSNIKNVEYYAEVSDISANVMCDMICS